jgi:dTDP-4-dehydrorhamnose 3,5-epimerase
MRLVPAVHVCSPAAQDAQKARKAPFTQFGVVDAAAAARDDGRRPGTIEHSNQDAVMKIERLAICDVLLSTPTRHVDPRGFFSETFRADIFLAHGVNAAFVQDNHVYSARKGVLRGLHFQVPPRAQGKLVRCTRGATLDVAVDIRKGSPTYGRHVCVELSAANWHQLWIPPGFAHGYVTLQDDCEVMYKVTDYYAPDCERGIAWDDSALAIDWRIPAGALLLSDKDRKHPRLSEAAFCFQFAG